MTERIRPQSPTVLLSARHRETGAWRTVEGEACLYRRWHRAGSLTAAVRDAVNRLEHEPGPWEVMAISYPGRILQDLRGHGADLAHGHARSPEAVLLGLIKRSDLIRDVGQRRKYPNER